MKILFSIFSILVAIFANAQAKKIFIYDSLNISPIYNVLVQTSKGDFYTNVNGMILIEENFQDSIHISHPRYFARKMKYNTSSDTIYLVSRPQLLEEFIIKTDYTEKITDLGYYDVGKRDRTSFIINDYSILAVFVPNTAKHQYIDKILLHLKSKKYAESYNVYLYASDSLGMPGKILYKQTVVCDSLESEGIINIRELKIKLPDNGIYVGLENLKIYEYGSKNPMFGMGVRFDFTEKFSDTKTCILIHDKLINPKGIWFDHSAPVGKNFTPCFGLQVSQKTVK